MDMRWLFIPILGLGLVACGQGSTEKPSDDGQLRKEFDERAQVVAEAWQAENDDWQDDFTVLDAPVSGPDENDLDEAQSSAIFSGWYELGTDLPGSSPQDVVPLGDTDVEVDAWDAETAYDELAVGGEPPADCPRRPADGDDDSGHDDDTSTGAQAVCGVLTITAMEPGTVPAWTNYGLVEVPAWVYTAEGLTGPITQIAFDIGDQTQTPQVDVAEFDRPEQIRAATGLEEVGETSLTILLGAGACDENFQPLIYEATDAIVVAGTAEHDGSQMCTDQMLLQPVEVELSAAIGDRMVIDAVTGSVLSAAHPFH